MYGCQRGHNRTLLMVLVKKTRDLRAKSSRRSRCCCRARRRAGGSFWVCSAPPSSSTHSTVFIIVIAPKPITRHLVLAAPPARPDVQQQQQQIATGAHLQNPARMAYPPDVLTHRFLPFGSESARRTSQPASSRDEDIMPVDDETPAPRPAQPESPTKKAWGGLAASAVASPTRSPVKTTTAAARRKAVEQSPSTARAQVKRKKVVS